MAKPKSESDQTQSERFKQAARELGCDESEERFEAALRKVVKHKPKAEEKIERPAKPE
jgi:hypothetical protein